MKFSSFECLLPLVLSKISNLFRQIFFFNLGFGFELDSQRISLNMSKDSDSAELKFLGFVPPLNSTWTKLKVKIHLLF
jgi:hypothetical protein